eukprot:TRINITY_DN3079_c0_g1_i1.p1 TRINITY_DN3079_c0_g1~~TRINITY_DN3079_c0_g1_i1.p1  ORF type:complete len:615 (+),score=152.58 TRINITY_DN3079_c0_g1_i1:233-2077(+)
MDTPPQGTSDLHERIKQLERESQVWMSEAEKYKKESQTWMTEAEKYKKEAMHWKQEFENLLEASLTQVINKASDEVSTSPPQYVSSPSPAPPSPGVADEKTPNKKKSPFPLFKKSTTSGALEKSEKDKEKEKKKLSLSNSTGSLPTRRPSSKEGKEGKGVVGAAISLVGAGLGGLGTVDQAIDITLEENSDFIPQSLNTFYQHLPRLKVMPVKNRHLYAQLSGPEGDNCKATYLNNVCAQSVSTYPHIPGNPTRDGEPICDQYNAHLYENRIVACIADGCSWGEKPRSAAKAASSAFVSYVNRHHSVITDVKKAGVVLLNAFGEAHAAIMEGKEAFWEAGTTTLLGGLLMEIDKGEDVFTPQWEFLCASVGDCKAYCFTRGEVTDITQGNRQNHDARDCGGRLGPHLDEGKPDLRNLNLFCVSCDEGDLIILVSDGIHDNLDPQQLGKLPVDMPRQFNLCPKTPESASLGWDDVDATRSFQAKDHYATHFLENLLEEVPGPEDAAQRLLDHCKQLTQKSRDYMENNQGKRLPENYVEFPGKMDHTTCLCLRVGRVPLVAQIPGPALSSVFAATPSSPPSESSSPTEHMSHRLAASLPRENWSKVTPSQQQRLHL